MAARIGAKFAYAGAFHTFETEPIDCFEWAKLGARAAIAGSVGAGVLVEVVTAATPIHA